MSFTSVKRLATACVVASVVFAGTVMSGGEVQAQRPPSISPFALVTREASQDLREQFQDLQANHDSDRLNATQALDTKRAARAVFAVTHPQLAKSTGLHAAEVEARSAAAIFYYYTDWYLTKNDNAWLGIEWWYNNVNGAWYGYTVTWDPSFGTQYGNQYLYYYAGTYYGYYYWK